MDETFEKLRKDGKNTVDNVIKWMKDAKVIGEKTSEEAARKLFDASAGAKVELDQFKTVLEQVAKEQKKNVDEIHKSLSGMGNQLYNAVTAGAKAFQEALQEKKT